MKHVFISYKGEDHSFAFELKEQVEGAGFDTWIDKDWLRAGEDWREEIDQALKDSFAMILILSPRVLTSKYVTYEFAFAWALGVKVIPILLETIDLRDFHPRLEGRQYEDFRANHPWGKLFKRLDEIKKEFGANPIFLPRNAPLAVRKAVEALDSHDPKQRKDAIATLTKISDPTALEALAWASTEHSNQELCFQAVQSFIVMTNYQDQRAIPTLRKMLVNTFDPSLKPIAARALGKIGASIAIDDLISVLETNTGSELTEAVLTAFGELRANEAFDLIVPFLTTKSWTESVAAAKALGQMADPRAIPYLLNVAKDVNAHPEVRTASIKALSFVEDGSVTPEISQIAHNRMDHFSIRMTAIELLGGVKNINFGAFINYLREEDFRIRRSAIIALEKYDDPQSIPDLIRYLNHEPEVGTQELISKLLIKFGTPEALTAVEEWRRKQQT